MIDTLIIRPITNLLFFIYNYVGDFGLAIIIFVVLVKLCMYPLTRSQLRQTKLMKQIQPELAEIKKNCKGNRQLESLQTMDLYKRYNVKPFRSFLTILIQLPIFIAIFGAIRIMVTPPSADSNLDLRAYSVVKPAGSNIAHVIDLQNAYLAEKAEYDTTTKDTDNTETTETAEPSYNFHPTLFGLVSLDARPGFNNKSELVMLAFAVLAAFVQFVIAKQQQPSGKKRGKTFRELMKQAGAGEDVDQADLNNLTSAQMAYMMPIMLLLIMVNLPGALVFYYFLSNLIALAQQTLVLKKAETEMEISADKAVLKELRSLQEAEVIENKKTGTKITRISAKDSKKKRR